MVPISRDPARAGCAIILLGRVRVDRIEDHEFRRAILVLRFSAGPAQVGGFIGQIKKPPARMGGGFILKQNRLTIAYRECPLNAGRR